MTNNYIELPETMVKVTDLVLIVTLPAIMNNYIIPNIHLIN